MQVMYINDPFPHVIIENVYEKWELDLIWSELSFYRTGNMMLPPEYGASAKTADGEYLKKNATIFLDTLYTNRDASHILVMNRRLFEKDVVDATRNHWMLSQFATCDVDFTLLSYYGDSEYYKPHQDAASYTALTHFFKEPKGFDGGDIVFEDFDFSYPVKNNRIILFNSHIRHAVKEVKMNNPDPSYGRWVMAQMLTWDFTKEH
jgi:hypothetical protein